MPNKNWSELTRKQKFVIALLSIIQFCLLVAALWDIKSRSDSEIKGSRKMWMALSFIDFIGPLAYFKFGRK